MEFLTLKFQHEILCACDAVLHFTISPTICNPSCLYQCNVQCGMLTLQYFLMPSNTLCTICSCLHLPQAGMTHSALYVCFIVQSTQDTVENLNHAKADLEKTVTRWVIDRLIISDC